LRIFEINEVDNTNFNWADLRDIPDMESRMILAESLFSNTNLFETNDPEEVDRFVNNMSSLSIQNPKINEMYILTMIGLIDNRPIVMQSTDTVKYLETKTNYYVVELSDGRIVEFPETSIREKMVIKSSLFDNVQKFDMFRSIMKMSYTLIINPA
jgi:hypothetical protein